MAIQTGSGVTLAIGTTLSATTIAGFEADSFTNVGEIAEIGAFGDQRTVVEFMSLADGRVRKARGSANAGDCQVTYAYDSTDSGQDAVRTAFAVTSQSLDEYNFRVQFNDSLGSNPTTWYWRAKITGRQVQSVTNDGIVTVLATLAINSAILEKEAA